MKLILTSLLFFSMLDIHGQCAGNIVSNGSFTSAEGEAVTAPGWSSLSTPDVNDVSGLLHCTAGYTWTGIPLASSDGGTWQNVFSPLEYIIQTLTVVPGQSYTLEFEYAAQGIISVAFTYTDPVGVNIYIDDVLTDVTSPDSTQYTWENYSYTFTAVNDTVNLKLSASDYFYAAIDGVCVTETPSIPSTPPVPIVLTPILEMPNVFTPDNDGTNDFFRPTEIENVKQASLVIINRWGELIYETDDAATGWDGEMKGENCTEGVYFWTLNYTTHDDQNLSTHGFLHLIR